MTPHNDSFMRAIFGETWLKMKRAIGIRVQAETPLGREVERLMDEARAAVAENHRKTMEQQKCYCCNTLIGTYTLTAPTFKKEVS
jgi:hypothetical protein